MSYCNGTRNILTPNEKDWEKESKKKIQFYLDCVDVNQTRWLTLKQAWCKASLFVVSEDFFILIDAHVLTSRGWRFARSIARLKSPASM